MFDIPIFINSYNRLTCIKQLIEWLERAGYNNIIVIDNASTYPLLLEYLDNLEHQVLRLKSNMGHLALYKCGSFNSYIEKNMYVYTDPDCVPHEDTPYDSLEYFRSILDKYRDLRKVGFGMRITDIPEHYSYKKEAIKNELSSHVKALEDKVYISNIDTTFCLYLPHKVNKKYITDNVWRLSGGAKTDEPYTVSHYTWYLDLDNLSEEDKFYKNSIQQSTHWSYK